MAKYIYFRLIFFCLLLLLDVGELAVAVAYVVAAAAVAVVAAAAVAAVAA